jgi:5-(carboxyamino)imidazole ribonucleotide synthase
MTVAPGSTIGIIGGGQLGRMLAIAAAQLGYKCHILDPAEAGPAAQVASRFTRAAYDDLAALRAFAASVDVATYEFENLPVAPLEVLGDKLRPSTRSLAIAQDREGVHRGLRRAGRDLAGSVEPCRRDRVRPQGRTSARAQDPAIRL